MVRLNKVVVTAALVFAAIMTLPSVSAAACQPGDKAEVLWKGTWYAASVLKAKGDQCFIHYDGYGSSWDEWVGPGRIRLVGGKATPAGGATFGEGDAVRVLWKGTWYDAHVLNKTAPNLWKIHYDGYDSSWDEVVGPNRIRRR